VLGWSILAGMIRYSACPPNIIGIFSYSMQVTRCGRENRLPYCRWHEHEHLD
jgi:hypothetical protein